MPRKNKTKVKAGKTKKQPAGVMVICILGFIASVAETLLGVMFIIFAPFLGSLVGPEFGTAAGALAAFLAIGASLIIFGVIGLLAFYHLWKMKLSGFILVNVYGILSVVSAILFFNLLVAAAEVIIWAIVLGYIWKKKNLFT